METQEHTRIRWMPQDRQQPLFILPAPSQFDHDLRRQMQCSTRLMFCNYSLSSIEVHRKTQTHGKGETREDGGNLNVKSLRSIILLILQAACLLAIDTCSTPQYKRNPSPSMQFSLMLSFASTHLPHIQSQDAASGTPTRRLPTHHPDHRPRPGTSVDAISNCVPYVLSSRTTVCC